jgi:hypothetical protein
MERMVLYIAALILAAGWLWAGFIGTGPAEFAPEFKGVQTVEEIVGPARGMAFGGWVPGLTKPGVQARSQALREQGFGPWISAQIAYEQSVEAGEIPLWQRLVVEALTSPIFLASPVLLLFGVWRLNRKSPEEAA